MWSAQLFLQAPSFCEDGCVSSALSVLQGGWESPFAPWQFCLHWLSLLTGEQAGSQLLDLVWDCVPGESGQVRGDVCSDLHKGPFLQTYEAFWFSAEQW